MILKSKKLLCIGTCFVLFVIGFGAYNIVNNNKPKTLEVQGVIADKEKDEVVAESEIILKGKVDKILPSKWSNPDFKKGEDIPNVLQTDVVIKTNKIYKGESELKNKNEVVVRIDKGYDPDLNLKVESEGYPDFIEGEKVLLFLTKDDSVLTDNSKEYYLLTGMFQGKYKFDGKDSYVLNKGKKKEKFNENKIEDEIKEENQKYKNAGKKKLTKEEIKKINSELFIEKTK